MPRVRRYFPAKQFYEVIFRAKEGLPLPALRIIELILQSALARTQRDDKVTLCHYLWMGNHPHVGCIAFDAESLVKFYQELQKKITDALKALLGLDRLEIWEGEPIVAIIRDRDAAVDQIAYWYANPARANLVDTIDHYPGTSSWQDFKSATNSIDATVEHEIPWIRLPAIPQLPSRSLSERQDEFLTQKLKASAKRKHALILRPNAWMKVFGVTDPEEVAELNARILDRLREKEEVAREKRKEENKNVIGAHKLQQQEILRKYTPKRSKEERRIYVISSINELRLEFIAAVKEITLICADLYQKWKKGDFTCSWPPGVFRPAVPPIANALY